MLLWRCANFGRPACSAGRDCGPRLLHALEACVRPAGFYRQKARTIRTFVTGYRARARRLVIQALSACRRKTSAAAPGACPEVGPGNSRCHPPLRRPAPVLCGGCLYAAGSGRGIGSPHCRGYHMTQQFLHAHLPRQAAFFNEFHALSGRSRKELLPPALPAMCRVPAGGSCRVGPLLKTGTECYR